MHARFSVEIIPTPDFVMFERKGSRRRSPAVPGQRFFKSGRLALYAILSSLKSRSNATEVLVPAYVCGVVIDACRWADLTPVFYAVREDLEVVLSDVEAKTTSDTLAAIGVHYFGFPSDLHALGAHCASYGVTLIEDGAHVDWDSLQDGALYGQYGQWFFSSLRKFARIYDGATAVPLESSGLCSILKRPSRSLKSELRGFKSAIETVVQAIRRKRSATSGQPVQFRASSQQQVKIEANDSELLEDSYVDHRFAPTGDDAMTLASRLLLRHCDKSSMMELRRHHYEQVTNEAKSWFHADVLFPSIPAGVAPYVVPLILARPERDYPRLRSLGVQALRWEELPLTDCKVSRDYEASLIQIPCHENLSKPDMKFMLKILSSVLSK